MTALGWTATGGRDRRLTTGWVLANVVAGSAIGWVAELVGPGFAVLASGLGAGIPQALAGRDRLPRRWLLASAVGGPLAWGAAALTFVLLNLLVAAAATALGRGAGPSAEAVGALATAAVVLAGAVGGAVVGLLQAGSLPGGSPDRRRWVLASALGGALVALPAMRVLSWAAADPRPFGLALTRPVGGALAGLGYGLVSVAALPRERGDRAARRLTAGRSADRVDADAAHDRGQPDGRGRPAARGVRR